LIYSLVLTIVINALSSQAEVGLIFEQMEFSRLIVKAKNGFKLQSFLLYCGLKFLCGFFVCGIILSSFVLQNELIGSNWRGVIGVLNQVKPQSYELSSKTSIS